MRAKKLLASRQIFRYAVPARTVTKKHWLQVSTNVRDGLGRCFRFVCIYAFAAVFLCAAVFFGE